MKKLIRNLLIGDMHWSKNLWFYKIFLYSFITFILSFSLCHSSFLLMDSIVLISLEFHDYHTHSRLKRLSPLSSSKQEVWLALLFSKKEWTNEAFLVSNHTAAPTTRKWGVFSHQQRRTSSCGLSSFRHSYLQETNGKSVWLSCLLPVVYILDQCLTHQRNYVPFTSWSEIDSSI